MIYISIYEGKKIYFASDQHFGAPTFKKSFVREQKFVSWLNEIKKDAQAIFLLGDLFDFWFEYKTVVPKGFIRVLGKLAEIKDEGISIYFFVGNHDLWMNNYFQKELTIPVFYNPTEFKINNTLFLIGHGDGLGPKDIGYKRMKKVFLFKPFQSIFRWLHPDLGVPLGQYLSLKNKLISGNEATKFLGEENEWLVQYCKRKLEIKQYSYFVFGHRHLPLNISLKTNSKYINLGDWIHYFTYGVFNGKEFMLKSYEK